MVEFRKLCPSAVPHEGSTYLLAQRMSQLLFDTNTAVGRNNVRFVGIRHVAAEMNS